MSLRTEMRKLVADATSYQRKDEFFKPDFNTCNRQLAIFPQSRALESLSLPQYGLPRYWCIWFLNEFANSSGHTNVFRGYHEFLIEHIPQNKVGFNLNENLEKKIIDSFRLVFSRETRNAPYIFRGGFVTDNSKSQPWPGDSSGWKRVYRRVIRKIDLEIVNQGKPNQAEYFLREMS